MTANSKPAMNFSHFYDDSSEDELSWDDYSDISFNPWAKSRRSSMRAVDNRTSLASFRFTDQSPSWESGAPDEDVVSPLGVKSVHKNPVKGSKRIKKTVRAPAPIQQNNEQSHKNLSSAPEKDLQTYMQALLGGSITEGIHQEMDLYEECLVRKSVHQPRLLSPISGPAPREYNKDRKRISVMSTVSDASAVPSLLFSDVDVRARRPSTLPINPHAQTAAFHRNSIISLNSIDSIASNRSWFMDDDSPPESPVEPTPLTKRVGFARGVELGMSCFDDGDDDDDEEEIQEEIQSPETACFVLMGIEASEKVPKTRKQNPGLSIQTQASRGPPGMLSPPLPPLTLSPISPRNSICASPNRRRSRRRTASSECIVLEALEKMNAVMYEFANEDINRKSVVGLDLPGNQVSVEAYGELWW